MGAWFSLADTLHLHYRPYTSSSHVPPEWRHGEGGDNQVFLGTRMSVLKRSRPLITEGKRKLFVPPFITLIDKTEPTWSVYGG